jgi:acylphosphatase
MTPLKSLEKLHFQVSGKVQGVGFRYQTSAKARSLGITGWVKNLADGRVEGLAEGEKASVDLFLAWCHQGPGSARVDQVSILERKLIERLEFQSFDIRP